MQTKSSKEWTPILPMHKDNKQGICKCGHKQQEHNNTTSEAGHGNCKKCSCTRFTWIKHQ